MMLMRPVMNLLLIMLCISSLAACGGPRPGASHALPQRKSKPQVNAADLERQIHALINKERHKQGLSQLRRDDELAGIAKKHSRDMAKRNYFDHVSPDGRDFMYRYTQEKYRCSVPVGTTIYMGAENIALNHLYDSVTTINGESFYDWNSPAKIAETTVRGWMESPGHRKNILTPHWKKEGIGVFISPDGKVYVTQNFC